MTRLSYSNVLWAYDRHLWEWWNEIGTLVGVKRKLEEETCLSVSTSSIRDVLRAGNPGGTIYNDDKARPLPGRKT